MGGREARARAGTISPRLPTPAPPHKSLHSGARKRDPGGGGERHSSAARIFCAGAGSARSPVRIPALKQRGRAERRGARRPMTLCTIEFECTGDSHHGVPEASGVPRAVFEACSAKPPVDVPFRPHPLMFRAQGLPTASGSSAMPFAIGLAPGIAAKRTRDARLAHRDQAAWAAATALRTPVTATAPAVRLAPADPRSPAPHLRRRLPAVPALERPRARPRMGRGDMNIVRIWEYCQEASLETQEDRYFQRDFAALLAMLNGKLGNGHHKIHHHLPPMRPSGDRANAHGRLPVLL